MLPNISVNNIQNAWIFLQKAPFGVFFHLCGYSNQLDCLDFVHIDEIEISNLKGGGKTVRASILLCLIIGFCLDPLDKSKTSCPF